MLFFNLNEYSKQLNFYDMEDELKKIIEKLEKLLNEKKLDELLKQIKEVRKDLKTIKLQMIQ